MGYWSDEREYLNNQIRLITQKSFNKTKENSELKEEIESLKMEIENFRYEMKEKVPVHPDQMALSFEWGEVQPRPEGSPKILTRTPDGRWNWWGIMD